MQYFGYVIVTKARVEKSDTGKQLGVIFVGGLFPGEDAIVNDKLGE
jgi:hypothetical protein